ncbi:MAG: PDGLE domain-containing protein [Candidatus Omnitrophota bacterium]
MTKKEILIAAGIVLLTVVFVAPFASNFPDGLERVAENMRFGEHAREGFFSSFFADYSVPYFHSDKVKTAAAGLVGTGIVFFVAAGCAKLILRRR